MTRPTSDQMRAAADQLAQARGATGYTRGALVGDAIAVLPPGPIADALWYLPTPFNAWIIESVRFRLLVEAQLREGLYQHFGPAEWDALILRTLIEWREGVEDAP